MKKMLITLLIATTLSGCASFAERLDACQNETGLDRNSCAQQLNAEDQASAARWSQFNAGLQAAAAQQQQQQAIYDQQNAAAMQQAQAQAYQMQQNMMQQQQTQALQDINRTLRGY
ncbi:hypothetical protein KE423_003910 [Salmonella enterica]|nr:hypothetical protein [Salmonella enterica]